ncbi:MAG: PAC2 family protein [Acidimicrobiaceae bacterium]|nr:PAC2 family protein [Acidimicrobiaceae bacterium]
MDDLVWLDSIPSELRRPILITAFSGWNDAAEAATLAIDFLRRKLNAKVIAEIDPEEFYDFTSIRPQVILENSLNRKIRWPRTSISIAHLDFSNRDLIFVKGPEPQLRWKRFASTLFELAEDFEVEMIVSLGALLADYPHTRPIRVAATSNSPDLVDKQGLTPSSYQGMTGIIGVLTTWFEKGGIPGASLWANIPHYITHTPSPKGARALIERLMELLSFRIDMVELDLATSEYDRHISSIIDNDAEAKAYIAQLEATRDLEEREDETVDANFERQIELGSIDSLTEEVQNFLRDHKRD